MIPADALLLAAGLACAWAGIAENVPLHRADGPDFDPKRHPYWPRAQCRTCGKVGIPVFRSTSRLFTHRIENGEECKDGGTYRAEIDTWDQSEEPWVE